MFKIIKKTPQERESAYRAMLDRKWADKPLRTVKTGIVAETRFGMDGAMMLLGANDRGRFSITIDGARISDADRHALSDALNAINNAHFDRTGAFLEENAMVLEIEAEGVWRKRRWKDSGGVQREAWDFVAARITWSHDGATCTLGWTPKTPESPVCERETEEHSA